MEPRLYKSSALIVLLLPHLAFGFTWVDDHSKAGFNCLGKVVDAICCQDSFCNANTEADCQDGNKQFLCSWTGSKCVSFRDSQNNVCCKSDVTDICASIFKGVCPDKYQVPEGCCSDDGLKYNGTLVGVKPGFVCCNTPCTDMVARGCQLPDFCAPKARSLMYSNSMRNPYQALGFYQVKNAQQVAIGNVLQGTGMGGDYATALLDSAGSGKSKKSQVDEITVDDLMSLLIESLADDKDAMVYNAELMSDPYLGKTKSGGPLTSMNLPDPNMFIEQIYGNPFGMSQANIGKYPSLPSPYASSSGMDYDYGYGYGSDYDSYSSSYAPYQSYNMGYQRYPPYQVPYQYQNVPSYGGYGGPYMRELPGQAAANPQNKQRELGQTPPPTPAPKPQYPPKPTPGPSYPQGPQYRQGPQQDIYPGPQPYFPHPPQYPSPVNQPYPVMPAPQYPQPGPQYQQPPQPAPQYQQPPQPAPQYQQPPQPAPQYQQPPQPAPQYQQPPQPAPQYQQPPQPAPQYQQPPQPAPQYQQPPQPAPQYQQPPQPAPQYQQPQPQPAPQYPQPQPAPQYPQQQQPTPQPSTGPIYQSKSY